MRNPRVLCNNYTWQLALVLMDHACIFHKTLGLMLYLLHTYRQLALMLVPVYFTLSQSITYVGIMHVATHILGFSGFCSIDYLFFREARVRVISFVG